MLDIILYYVRYLICLVTSLCFPFRKIMPSYYSEVGISLAICHHNAITQSVIIPM